MNDVKPWYLSRTIWASAVTVVLGMAGTLKISVESVDEAALADMVFALVTALAGLTAIVGRVQAKNRIGKE